MLKIPFKQPHNLYNKKVNKICNRCCDIINNTYLNKKVFYINSYYSIVDIA
jgi:hypothetical protein